MRGKAFCCLIPMLLALSARAEVVDIDNAELARLTAAGVPIIDIRTAAEWQETGVLPGSKLLTFFDERGRADAPAWLRQVQSVATAEQPLILICRTGNRTRVVARLLSEQAAYRKVYNVSKGIVAWRGDGRPVVPISKALTPCVAATAC